MVNTLCRELEHYLKLVGLPSLLPFAITIAVYIVSSVFLSPCAIPATLVKCAPTLSLIFFVYGPESKRKSNKSLLAYGLVFSALGDALLEFDRFAGGISAFAIAHVLYIIVFGWRPLRLAIAVWLAIPLIVVLLTILPTITDPTIAVGLPVYAVLLATMSWRAMARVGTSNKAHQYLEIATAIGSVLFIVSDTLIAVDRFYTAIPCRNLLIMGTYYAAQLTISMAATR